MADYTHAFSLAGKAAVVTGGGSGIGEATAKLLAAAGASVIIADWKGDSAEQVAKAITADGGRALALTVDVSDPDAVTALVGSAVQEFGALDIMVNNAGILIRRRLLDVSPEEFDRILSVNLKGVLYGCQAAARVMSAGSCIVNTLSSIIDTATVETGSYAAAKRGALSLTRTLALELGPRGIRVNGIAPGWTISSLTRQRGLNDDGEFEQERFDAVKARLADRSPLGVVLDADDIANGVLYLVSDAARYVTGQVLRVNAGCEMA